MLYQYINSVSTAITDLKKKKLILRDIDDDELITEDEKITNHLNILYTVIIIVIINKYLAI